MRYNHADDLPQGYPVARVMSELTRTGGIEQTFQRIQHENFLIQLGHSAIMDALVRTGRSDEHVELAGRGTEIYECVVALAGLPGERCDTPTYCDVEGSLIAARTVAMHLPKHNGTQVEASLARFAGIPHTTKRLIECIALSRDPSLAGQDQAAVVRGAAVMSALHVSAEKALYGQDDIREQQSSTV